MPKGSVLKPLGVTMRQAMRSLRKPITVRYPYERMPLPPSVRCQHVIDWDKCIGCEICAKVCPNECIYFEAVSVPPKHDGPPRSSMDAIKNQVMRPGVDVGHCLFCGNCAEFCPTDAWAFTDEFELADYAREDLHYGARELMLDPEKSDKDHVLNNRMGENPILEADKCIGCLRCEKACPTSCIVMIDGPAVRKDKPIKVPDFDYTKCIGCSLCAVVCPADCLYMEEVAYDNAFFYHVNLKEGVPATATGIK